MMEHIRKISEREFKGFTISKRRLKQVESIAMVRHAREERNQSIGYSSRPFILCGLPIRRREGLEYTRRNGQFFLSVVGHPRYGLPYGGYRAVQLEAGILGGKLYLGAYAQRLGATGLTFYDDEVIEFFSPHAAGKSAIFLMALGKSVKRG